MDSITIEEGNILIDIFKRNSEVLPDGKSIGMKRGSVPRYYNYYDTDLISELQYHTSWDWLMPVVKKIGEIDNEWLADCRCPEIEPLLTASIFTPIHSAWNYVVQFIQWYNSLTSK